MRLAVIGFTEQGSRICERLVKRFREMGEECKGYAQERHMAQFYGPPGLIPLKVPLAEWTKRQFEDRDGIIFVGATGIAVRSVAPYLKGKTQDPAVVVVDELGRYSISLLSGHVGGANRLARLAAEIVGAVPVITTATDINGRFAVDEFAARRGLVISDMREAKEISVSLLEGRRVGFFSDIPLKGPLPDGLTGEEMCRQNIWVSPNRKPGADSLFRLFWSKEARILKLIPPWVWLGIGCRKGVEREVIALAVERFLKAESLEPQSIAGIASIDRKRGERGLVTFAEGLEIPFVTYSAEELKQAPGEFSCSDFVRGVTGVENVCERAAVLGAGDGNGPGRLIGRKTVFEGVTVAAAIRCAGLWMMEEKSE